MNKQKNDFNPRNLSNNQWLMIAVVVAVLAATGILTGFFKLVVGLVVGAIGLVIGLVAGAFGLVVGLIGGAIGIVLGLGAAALAILLTIAPFVLIVIGLATVVKFAVSKKSGTVSVPKRKNEYV